MISALRFPAAIFLALIVSFGSLVQATARHQAAGAETLVICSGYGLVRITLDVDGNPVEQTLPCPDCTIMAQAVLEAVGFPGHTATAEAVVVAVPTRLLQLDAPHYWPQSRAPPLPV